MGLITENNAHYYSGQQGYVSAANATNVSIKWVGDTILKPTIQGVQNSNYQVFINNQLKTETTDYTLVGDSVVVSTVSTNDVVIIQLVESARQENYGSYAYTKLDDIVNNFLVAYVGDGKMILSAKRTDIVFFAKRAMQEFSYDTLKSVRSQEIDIPPSLSIPIPQDYVNYVNISWIDRSGIKHIIYPTTLTSNPTSVLLQDGKGTPIQDSFGTNIETPSVTEQRWNSNGIGTINNQLQDGSPVWADVYGGGFGQGFAWQSGFYGIQPEISQVNGWFTINERTNSFCFSNDLVGRTIILEYISDGLAYDLDTRVPKMAEEAMYAYILHAIVSTRINQPEYLVQRLRQEKSAKLRNAKIRLSNIKLSEFVQVMRGKSKWIKS
tara:strand:+ start:3276 stop:4418 length:1143 start_codon:yes stop_codon:yes gene_type:complete